MGLLKRFIRKDLADLHRNGVRVRIIGEREQLPNEIRVLLSEAEELTRDNDGLVLVVAFNYGGRQEIAAAMRRIALAVRSGEIDPDAVDCDMIKGQLDTAGIPDPGPDHPHVGRAEAVEFSAVAGRLCGIRLPAVPLAGIRQGRVRGGADGLPVTRTAFWRHRTRGRGA